jgi:hypothetical protein
MNRATGSGAGLALATGAGRTGATTVEAGLAASLAGAFSDVLMVVLTGDFAATLGKFLADLWFMAWLGAAARAEGLAVIFFTGFDFLLIDLAADFTSILSFGASAPPKGFNFSCRRIERTASVT